MAFLKTFFDGLVNGRFDRLTRLHCLDLAQNGGQEVVWVHVDDSVSVGPLRRKP